MTAAILYLVFCSQHGLAASHANSRAAIIEEGPEVLSGVNIGKGKLFDLLARLGDAKPSEVRHNELFNDGWTCWWIAGRRNELLTVYWEPAFPKSRRTITRVTLESFVSKDKLPTVKPSLLGFWGSIKLGATPPELIQQLRGLGKPYRPSAQMLEWVAKNVDISARFDKGELESIAIELPRLPDQDTA